MVDILGLIIIPLTLGVFGLIYALINNHADRPLLVFKIDPDGETIYLSNVGKRTAFNVRFIGVFAALYAEVEEKNIVPGAESKMNMISFSDNNDLLKLGARKLTGVQERFLKYDDDGLILLTRFLKEKYFLLRNFSESPWYIFKSELHQIKADLKKIGKEPIDDFSVSVNFRTDIDDLFVITLKKYSFLNNYLRIGYTIPSKYALKYIDKVSFLMGTTPPKFYTKGASSNKTMSRFFRFLSEMHYKINKIFANPTKEIFRDEKVRKKIIDWELTNYMAPGHKYNPTDAYFFNEYPCRLDFKKVKLYKNELTLYCNRKETKKLVYHIKNNNPMNKQTIQILCLNLQKLTAKLFIDNSLIEIHFKDSDSLLNLCSILNDQCKYSNIYKKAKKRLKRIERKRRIKKTQRKMANYLLVKISYIFTYFKSFIRWYL